MPSCLLSTPSLSAQCRAQGRSGFVARQARTSGRRVNKLARVRRRIKHWLAQNFVLTRATKAWGSSHTGPRSIPPPSRLDACSRPRGAGMATAPLGQEKTLSPCPYHRGCGCQPMKCLQHMQTTHNNDLAWPTKRRGRRGPPTPRAPPAVGRRHRGESQPPTQPHRLWHSSIHPPLSTLPRMVMSHLTRPLAVRPGD
jgi:hypothetical protein